jgi:hypothetical protein
LAAGGIIIAAVKRINACAFRAQAIFYVRGK